ncbi:MAG: sigma-70 family RNA polymerase sigma factor [Cyclobacteriaceae bacterium]
MTERDPHNTDAMPEGRKGENTSDQLMWRTFREGNRKTFQYIYDQNYGILLRYGLKIIPDQGTVEDHIQELFIYLWKQKANLEIRKSITVYLIWSLRNRLLKFQEKQKVLGSDESLETLEVPEYPQERLSSEELKSAVDSLPGKQREVIYLKYYQNLDGQEIAQIMEITLGTTYNLLSRAIANLRTRLPGLIFLTFYF